jgi:hypothetical protein
VFPCKRHQMWHLCDLARLLAKQMPSQFSYTPAQLHHFKDFYENAQLLSRQVLSLLSYVPTRCNQNTLKHLDSLP